MALTRHTFPTVTGGIEEVRYVRPYYFVVINNGGVRTVFWSTDKSTWTDTGDAATAGVSTGIQFLGYAGGHYFLRRVGSSSVPLLRSTDLVTWTAVTGLPAAWGNAITGIAANANNSTLVAVAGTYLSGPEGPYQAHFAQSANLTSWAETIVYGDEAESFNQFGEAHDIKFHDGLWFLRTRDEITYSPVVRSSVLTSPDLSTWSLGVEEDDNDLSLTSDNRSLFVLRTTAGAGRISQWTGDSFETVPTETQPELYFTSAGHHGSLVAQIDDDDEWGTFANFSQYSSITGEWRTVAIGTPDAPVVFATYLWYWVFGDDGTLFYSQDLPDRYIDFLDAETHGAVVATSPLGAPSVLAVHDFTAAVADSITNYVCDLETPGGLVRVPISSWQATIQTGDASYVQCVVPACADWIEDLNAATEFVISRTVTYDGTTIEYEMARSALQTLSLAQGPTNYSATLSGYPDALTAVVDPPVAYDRTLAGVRAVFITGANTRARASIDWLLRPGHRAYAGSAEIIVDFISYYVGGGDAYMDVGERA